MYKVMCITLLNISHSMSPSGNQGLTSERRTARAGRAGLGRAASWGSFFPLPLSGGSP